jgi:hypothetical protein
MVVKVFALDKPGGSCFLVTETVSDLQSTLAVARQAHASGDAMSSLLAYKQAHLIAPTDRSILLDLAVAFLACNDPAQAVVHASRAATLKSQWRSCIVLATSYKRLNQADLACENFNLALNDELLPLSLRANAFQQLADIHLNAFGNSRRAADYLRSAALVNSKFKLDSDLADLVADLYEGGKSAQHLSTGFANLAAQLYAPDLYTAVVRPSRARMRVGLLSQQFCASPVGFLAQGALLELSKNADLIFFDRGSKSDWAQSSFKAHAKLWLKCGELSAKQLNHLIAQSDLDALIDLSGWTDPQALCALSSKPAQKQLKWVGGQSLSTGMRCFDGFVTDRRQAPTAAHHLYSESLLFARHGYVSYTAPPYAMKLANAASNVPRPRGYPPTGVVAVASNPAKISHETVATLVQLKPKKIFLIDQRWLHQGARNNAHEKLGDLMDITEFISPTSHLDYLMAIEDADATFIDTSPYSMGLSAIELRLLGKHIHTPTRNKSALMCERHCTAHVGARRFDHHKQLADQLLGWCRS